MKKKTLIIISGKQGIGKTRLLNFLGKKEHQIDDLESLVKGRKFDKSTFITTNFSDSEFITNELNKIVDKDLFVYVFFDLKHNSYDELKNDDFLIKKLKKF